MTDQNEEETLVETPEDTSEDNRVLVSSGDASFDRVTGDLVQDLNENFGEALRMRARLNQSYIGYKYNVHFPSSCEATIQPEMFPEDIQEKYRDEKLKLGKMDTMPTWLKKIGSGIRSSVTSALLRYCSNTDTRFGYMVMEDHWEDVESSLLAIKGIEDSDRQAYEGTSIVSKAEELIEVRRSKRNEWEVMRHAPVTYLEYISYFQDNYNILREEIIAEYNRLFEPEVVEVITSLIPNREAFFNNNKIRFSWRTSIEMPEAFMERQADYLAVSERVERGRQLRHELEGIKRREVETWKTSLLDSVADIQRGVRRLIAEKVRRLKERLDKPLMTEEQIDQARESGKQRVVDPARVTEASVEKLLENIGELTSELGQFDTTDEFYTSVTAFTDSLGLGKDFDDTNTRQELSQDIDNIINLSLDDSSINPRTGEFFSGLI